MAQHPDNCEICQRLEDVKHDHHPGFIAHLPTGVFVLGDSQQFRGYSLLLCNEPVPDLEDLSWDTRLEFLRDVALCSQAMANVLHPHKMNVESLGNMVPHLHFHLFPRQLDEPERLKPVWTQTRPDAPALDKARDAELIAALREEIEHLKTQRL